MLYLVSLPVLNTKTSLHMGALGSSHIYSFGFVVFLPTKQGSFCIICIRGVEEGGLEESAFIVLGKVK